MRVSGIEQFLGGADNVIALEVLQGEQRILKGTLKDKDGNALDITNYRIDAGQEFYSADVTTSSRSTAISALESLTVAGAGTITTVKGSDPTNGEFEITIPDDLYPQSATDINTDITTGVPICVAYIRYSDGNPGNTGVTSRVNRFVIIIRRSTF